MKEKLRFLGWTERAGSMVRPTQAGHTHLVWLCGVPGALPNASGSSVSCEDLGKGEAGWLRLIQAGVSGEGCP